MYKIFKDLSETPTSNCLTLQCKDQNIYTSKYHLLQESQTLQDYLRNGFEIPEIIHLDHNKEDVLAFLAVIFDYNELIISNGPSFNQIVLNVESYIQLCFFFKVEYERHLFRLERYIPRSERVEAEDKYVERNPRDVYANSRWSDEEYRADIVEIYNRLRGHKSK